MYELPKNLFKTLFSLYDSRTAHNISVDIAAEGIYFGTPYIVGFVAFNENRGKSDSDAMFSFSRHGHFNRACSAIIFDDKACELTIDGQAIDSFGPDTVRETEHSRRIWNSLTNSTKNHDKRAKCVSVKTLDRVIKVLKLFKVEQASFTRFYGVEGCGPYIAQGDSADGRYSVHIIYMTINDMN